MHPTRVGFVNMPFVPIHCPSIGLGLLKAGLAKRSIPSDVWYFNLRFAEMMGAKPYSDIVSTYRAQVMLGEYLFTQALYDHEPRDEEYIDEVVLQKGPMKRALEVAQLGRSGELMAPREHVEPFLDWCMTAAPWADYAIVGFTSVFQQHIASLALAKRLKERYPHLFIIFGGANVEGDMGLATLESFPFVDAICSGEGDEVFPAFVETFLQTGQPPALPGLALRRPPAEQGDLIDLPLAGTVPHTPAIHDMDALPFPDYDDYFQQLDEAKFERIDPPRVLIETSRGCWWGEKNHCVFCGLNSMTMKFRSKSAQRALDELLYLRERYGKYTNLISAVDNILDMKYFKDFIPALKALEIDIELFYETKANLRRDQLEAMRDAGIAAIQPGIESLDTDILRLMRKGVSALQNIQLLKWCKEHRIWPSWNFLFGFVGETPAQYEAMARMVPSLTHLPPCGGWGQIRLDRFSPYYYEAAETGLVDVRPFAAYTYLYPSMAAEVRQRFAYYFDYSYREPHDVTAYTESLRDALLKWQQDYMKGADLFSMEVEGTDGLVVFDFRSAGEQHMIRLSPVQRSLYEFCDSVRSRQSLLVRLQETEGPAADLRELDSLLMPLLEDRILLCIDDHYLSLAIPVGTYTPRLAALKQMVELAEQGRALVIDSAPVR
ncbi:MAG TPA: RiPP maturation radical SAM C-methyltransferase [Symbiobacteriaceae bacterium]|nr:RiPP maturation radical SAM C-methyltransferase [Symbiobacteriaceae bacterium]